MTRTSTRDTQTLKGSSDSVSVGSPGAHKVSFEPSECLWELWGLILNTSSPLLLSSGASPLPLDMGYLFQQQDIILEFSQEMSTSLSTQLSCGSDIYG